MAKILQFNETALRSMSKGIESLARAVSLTLGPKGRNVVINREMATPLSTKDGVSVAREIVLKDKFENIGAQLVREASSKTSDVAGDGTTTAIVLAEAIFKEGFKNVIAGTNPMQLKKGINQSVHVLIEALDKLAIPVNTSEEIRQVATISANNDPDVGSIVTEAMEKVGKEGTITIAEAKGIETILDVVEGMQFDRGYLSPYFMTDPKKMSVEMSHARVLLTDRKISSAKQIVPVLEKVLEGEQRPLLIIAEDVEGEALATLVLNKLRANRTVCAVKAPSFGDKQKAILQDIAALTGATVISDEIGLTLEEVDLSALGNVKTVKVSKDETTLIGGEGDEVQIEKRTSQIRYELKHSSSKYDQTDLESRLAKLSGGVAVIHVGAATETEMKEKKARVEDALHATRAAVIGGIVPGGGVALLRAVKALDSLNLEGDEKVGASIMHRALFSPASVIASNCGKEGQVIAEKVFESSGSFGYNGLTDKFEDLIRAGVIDPVLVTKSALQHASSVASLLITVACMITEKPKPKAKVTPPTGGGGMSGMGGMM